MIIVLSYGACIPVRMVAATVARTHGNTPNTPRDWCATAMSRSGPTLVAPEFRVCQLNEHLDTLIKQVDPAA
jgi:hypothetical protein